MVEKIIVSPESIRGVGNIVVPKTGADFEEYNCALEVGEDTVNGEDVTVYVLTPETTIISLVLSSSVGSCGIGDSVVLSVTVTEDSVPVSGQSVSFKLGGTEIGTGTTNSSGVATYTYTATDVGSLNFTSVYAGHSSNSVSVVVRHEYSIAFSQSSYPATSGSATLSLTLTDNSVPVEGATISVSGSDGSLYTGITNSSGIATVTVTVNSDTTFTASYSNVTATCTVTVSRVLYQPALDGTESKYQLTGSTTIANGEMYGGSSYLTAGWDNTGNWELTCKFKPTGPGCGIVLILPNTTSRDRDNLLLQRGTSSMELFIHTGTSTTSEDRTTFSSFTSTNVWYDVTITKTSSTSLTVAVSYGSTTKTKSYSWSKLSSTTMCVGLDKWSTGNSYIKDIKVEAL